MEVERVSKSTYISVVVSGNIVEINLTAPSLNDVVLEADIISCSKGVDRTRVEGWKQPTIKANLSIL